MEYLRAQQFVHLHSSGELPGTNIMGVLPGQMWGTAEDRVLVVGAHWDTVTNTGGLDDNGSGVAAMLELGKVSPFFNLV